MEKFTLSLTFEVKSDTYISMTRAFETQFDSWDEVGWKVGNTIKILFIY